MTPVLGEIIMFGGNFAPRGWALCNGQLLPISQNQALFSLLGTIYGGDGRTTFALPELRGRFAMHSGDGPGLSPRRQGAKSGSETNRLTLNQMPQHNHIAQVSIPISEEDATTTEPGEGGLLSTTSTDGDDVNVYGGAADGSTYSGGPINAVVGHTGGGQDVNNLQPYTTVNYIIALQGTFPSRN